MKKILPFLALAASAALSLSSCDDAKAALTEDCHVYAEWYNIQRSIRCETVPIHTCSELAVSETKSEVVNSCDDVAIKENCHLCNKTTNLTIECKEDLLVGSCDKLSATPDSKVEIVASCSNYGPGSDCP